MIQLSIFPSSNVELNNLVFAQEVLFSTVNNIQIYKLQFINKYVKKKNLDSWI